MTLFVNKLLERGANSSFTLSDLNTALHFAAAKGYTAVAHCLVENDAFVDARNRLNETPLEIAITNHKNDFATFMVKSMRPGRYTVNHSYAVHQSSMHVSACTFLCVSQFSFSTMIVSMHSNHF